MQFTGINQILLSIVSIMQCGTTTYGHVVQSNFRAPGDRYFLLGNENLALVRSRSLLDCARQCLQHHLCASFDFERKSHDHMTSQCRLKTLASTDPPAVVTSSSTFVHYDQSPVSGASPSSPDPQMSHWVQVTAATRLSSLLDGILVMTPQQDLLLYASMEHLSSGPAASWNLSHFLEDWGDKKVNDIVQKDSVTVSHYYVLSGTKVYCMTIKPLATLVIALCDGPTFLGIPTWQKDTIDNVLGSGFPADMCAFTEVAGTPYGFRKDTVHTANKSYNVNSSNPDNLWRGLPAGYTAISRTPDPDLYLVFADEDYYIHNISNISSTYQGKVAGP